MKEKKALISSFKRQLFQKQKKKVFLLEVHLPFPQNINLLDKKLQYSGKTLKHKH